MALDIASYKVKLTETLSRVTGELQTLGVRNRGNRQDWIATPEPEAGPQADPNDAADRVEAWDEHAATLSELEQQYTDVNRALQKIEAGVYGACEVCGQEIETDRLDANAAARTCKAHKEAEGSLPQ